MVESMKVVILGFDGLEYYLVERFRLKNMKQKQYGKLSIPKECYTQTVDPLGKKVYEPWTPYVWSAFLTGKLPTETGINKPSLARWDNPVLQFLRVFSIKVGLDRIRNKGKIFEKLGFKRTGFSMENYKCPTIFSYAKKPCIINVPTISKNWGVKLEGKTFDEMLQATWHRFYDVRNETLSAVKEGDWDLLMAYTRLLDVIGELCFRRFKLLFKAYSICNQYVGQIKKNLDNDTICLIISDHGMERFGNTPFGKHSNHAFYSLNIKTNWKPKTVLDFFHKISEWLAM